MEGGGREGFSRSTEGREATHSAVSSSCDGGSGYIADKVWASTAELKSASLTTTGSPSRGSERMRLDGLMSR